MFPVRLKSILKASVPGKNCSRVPPKKSRFSSYNNNVIGQGRIFYCYESSSSSPWIKAAVGVSMASTAAAVVLTMDTDEESSLATTTSSTFGGNNTHVSYCQEQQDQATDTTTFTSGGKAPQNPVETMATSASSITDNDDDQKFRIKDVYEIEQILGEGAYGMVYQARRKHDNTLVAVKAMPRNLTGKTDFEREVAALQLLSKPPSQPNIVQFIDLHRDDANYYLVMELIQGCELLDHLIQNGPYSEGVAASYLRQFAEAIAHVHNVGLVHADLKPENLLLTTTNPTTRQDRDNADEEKKQDDDSAALSTNINNDVVGQLKVADFGCARNHDLSRKEMYLPAEEFAMGCSFLHMVALGNQFELTKQLQTRPTLVNFRDYDFRTPLHLAASEGHVDICRFLIGRGAKLNRKDRWGGTPLDDAYRQDHGAVVELLRQEGATFGDTKSKRHLPRFIQAASEGDIQEVKALLEFGSTINVNQGDYDRRTALHLAAGEGKWTIVKLLVDGAKANVNVEDRWGNRPLDDAHQYYQQLQQDDDSSKLAATKILKLLVKHGAKSKKNPSIMVMVDKLLRDTGSDDLEEEDDSSSLVHGKLENSMEEEEEETTGTIAYWSPELFPNGSSPTPASDMWAAGIIMFVLLTGSHPFDKYADLTDDQVQEAILRVHPKNDNCMEVMDEIAFDDERIGNLSDSCIELMRQLMHPDPSKRPTSAEFLRHPWIQGLTANWTTMETTHDELKAFWQSRFRTEIVKKFITRQNTKVANTTTLSEPELKKLFETLDIKKNGVLELDEIQSALRDVGISEQNIKTIFKCADLDGTGVIRYDEFRALLLNNQQQKATTTSSSTTSSSLGDGKQPGLHVDYLQKRFRTNVLRKFMTNPMATPSCSDEDKLREMFNAIDLEGNGVLDAHEIRVVLRSAGEPEDVISRMVASLDLDRDGRVSWAEFLTVMGIQE